MVVSNFDVPCCVLAPLEAYPPLIIDTDAVWAISIAVQCFEAIAWWNAQILQFLGRVDREKLGSRSALNLVREIPNRMARE